MNARFKLITANSPELFEERLNGFVASLGRGDVILDVKFMAASTGSGLEYSALVHYQRGESWESKRLA